MTNGGNRSACCSRPRRMPPGNQDKRRILMPLNDDPEAVSDEHYAELSALCRANAEAEGNPPCRAAVPADVLAESLARLDAQDG